MPVRRRITILTEVVLCSLGLMIFSYFIHYKMPVRLISFAALFMSAFIISRNLRSMSDLKKITGEVISLKVTVPYTLAGIALGALLAFLYRLHLNITLFPVSIHPFVIAAMLIGCTEELVFRGFIQGQTGITKGPFSVLLSTLSHTGYKCCLFLSPVITEDVNVGFLAFYTFIAGLIFGSLRLVSKNLLPSLSGHALFDVLVYAEFVSAPWWVW
jgi:membrane protease YdiL (CAAX protease family)